MRPDQSLKAIADQVIVITGASSGIGLATAYKAARQGARVVLAARSRAALQAAVDRIRADGGVATYAVADVSKPADLEAVAQIAIRTFGGFDTWVNNAGVGIFGRLLEVSVTLIKPSAIDTPFAEHAKNYMRQQAKLPPPVYRPEDVAEAIVYAAAHGGRDYYIGGGGKLMSVLNKHLPSLVDWLGARMIGAMSTTGEPVGGSGGGMLFAAGCDGSVRGSSPHLVMHSLYTKATLRPALSGAVLAITGLATAALLHRRARA